MTLDQVQFSTSVITAVTSLVGLVFLIVYVVKTWHIATANARSAESAAQAARSAEQSLNAERQHRLLEREARAAENMLSLQREFFHDQGMIERRRCAAEHLLRTEPWSAPHAECESNMACRHQRPPRELQDILNFFDVMGQLLRKGVLDAELVESMFGFWIRHYHACTVEYQLRNRLLGTVLWQDFEALHSKVAIAPSRELTIVDFLRIERGELDNPVPR